MMRFKFFRAPFKLYRETFKFLSGAAQIAQRRRSADAQNRSFRSKGAQLALVSLSGAAQKRSFAQRRRSTVAHFAHSVAQSVLTVLIGAQTVLTVLRRCCPLKHLPATL
jgi:hypothetical protein